MSEVKRYFFEIPAGAALQSVQGKSAFVLEAEFDAQRRELEEAQGQLIRKDADLVNANQKLEKLSNRLDDFFERLEMAQKPVEYALGVVGDIRRGENVTAPELWRTCEYLDTALSRLQALISLKHTELMQSSTAAEPADAHPKFQE